MSIKERIPILLEEKRELTVKEMTDIMGVSKQGIHVALKQLLQRGEVVKFGRAPMTIYRLPERDLLHEMEELYIDSKSEEFLDKHFLLITELGEMLEGLKGFSLWCRKRNLPVVKTISEYIKTRKKYEQYYNSLQLINGLPKLNNTKGYEDIYLDQLFYLDFYAIERFGKTRLGTLLHFAKQGQNKYLMKKLVKEIGPTIDQLLKNGDFDAVAFVPPTIRRETQIMKYLERYLEINLPQVTVHKVSGIIAVPQKSLSRIEERINNAEKTFAVAESVKFNHLLLIDDAVGSGATLNQIAGKLKRKDIAKKVTGLAIVGSFKGFDVITDI